MLFLEFLRKQAFYIVDLLRGAPVRKHLDEIETAMNASDRDRLQELKLNKILSYASQNVPFYKDLKYKTIAEFRVVDKALLRERTNEFLSLAIDEKQRIPAVTSGSTGTPFKVFHDRNKKQRNHADTMHFAKAAGFEVGNKLVYLKIWSDNNKKSGILQWMQNIVPVDVITLDDIKLQHLVEKLESDHSTIGILGYSSALELLARYVKNRKPIKHNVRSIISMSEGLNIFTKETLSEYFGVAAVSRYSNIENGIIAQQETNSELKFLINSASYYVEILNLNNDNVAPHGELGRIVITDLYNKAMPLIRYDTGDLGAFSTNSRHYLEVIEGRKLDQLYDTKGKLVSSYIVYKNMWQYTDIQQYQLVQDGNTSYKFKINVAGKFEKEQQLISEFKYYLGSDADFKVEYVSEIPLLASGKRKKIVNTFHNK